MTRERAAELLSEVMVLDDPEMAEAHRVAISALRQQERFGETNKTLTMDELRQMPCEPVYIVAGYVSWWDIVSFAGMEYLYLKVEGSLPFGDYGKNWTAYRQKPEEDDHDERKENENVRR